MEIFYIDIEKAKKQLTKDFLTRFCDKKIKTEKNFYEYTLGRFLIKTIGEKLFGLENTEIITDEKGKPKFKNNFGEKKVYFSLSHSKNFVIACFDNFECGVDIELMKKRDLNLFSQYYKKEFKNTEDFYKFWTQKEAEYKLNKLPKSVFHLIFGDYYICAVSANKNAFTQTEIKDFFNIQTQNL